MEEIIISNEIPAFGFVVKTFPEGIDNAFKELIEKTGEPAGKRDYYGISYFEDGKLYYVAAAAEKQPGEAAALNYKSYTISSGKYISALVTGWQSKLSEIKDVCMNIVSDERSDKKMPCIEWYKNSEELICMIKAKP